MTVYPGCVFTRMNPMKSITTITPEQHAESVIDSLGYDSETVGHYIHGIQRYIMTAGAFNHIISFFRRKGI